MNGVHRCGLRLRVVAWVGETGGGLEVVSIWTGCNRFVDQHVLQVCAVVALGPGRYDLPSEMALPQVPPLALGMRGFVGDDTWELGPARG